MKALSVRQPWGWGIIHAGKPVENRSWPTSFRGPVLIHASSRISRDEYERFCEFVEDIPGVPPIPPISALPIGGIIGQAEITDCVTFYDSPWFTGPFGFILQNVKPLPFRRCKGALGFFEVPE